MKDYYFYERNDFFLNHETNKTFEEVLWMTDEEFKEWIVAMREAIVYGWDVRGCPPIVGYTRKDILKQFNSLAKIPILEMEYEDEYEKPGWNDCIRYTHNYGNPANQWFPTMMKTRINYNVNNDGLSIYDHFTDDKLLKKVVTYASRHFKRDSFYAYSQVVQHNDSKTLFQHDSAKEWIKEFEFRNMRKKCDYWLEAVEEDVAYTPDKAYTGYSDELRASLKPLILTDADLEELGDLVPERCKINTNHRTSGLYRIRLFKYGQKIFPLGFKAFKISWCQYATNFPPLIAKYLYQKYSKPNEQTIIWDPSAGWGGRILAAMSVENINRNIHYIGTDPNTDHNTPDGRTKYHNLADFFNEQTNRGNNLFSDEDDVHTYEIFQCGSEVMREQEGFQKYKGKIDIVFTSPPYFAKEAYSEDDEQSYKKFPEYGEWRDGFLQPTLEIAAEWLKPGGLLMWNIADAKFANNILPLEQDSMDIIGNLNFKFLCKYKMILAQMPGGNRVDYETKLPKCKNFCKLGGKWFKYEPIWIYQKI